MTTTLGTALLYLAVYVLAVMRVVRLINFDTVLDSPRAAIVRVFGPGSKVVYFITCPWCVGFWVALVSAIAPVLLIGWAWWAFIPVALATSYIVGALAPLTADDEMEFEEVEVD